MKVNKKILLLLPLLVVVFLLLWFAFQPAASTAEFLHNSVEYSKTSLYEVESIMLEEGKPSRNTVTEPQLIDFDMKQPMDPAVWFCEAAPLTVYVSMKQGSRVRFQTLQYTENGEERTADLGRYDIRYVKGKALQESEFFGNTEEQVINIRIRKKAYGRLKTVEPVNRDLKVKAVEISEDEKSYRIRIPYQDFSAYDYIYTNLKYTFEKDGRKEIYYGEQVLPIHKEFGIDYHVIID